MKNSHVQYTLAEDEIICQCVRNMPHNLVMAFEKAAILLEREVNSIKCRYYNRVRYMFKMLAIVRIGENRVKDPFIMMDKAFIYNVKNLRR